MNLLKGDKFIEEVISYIKFPFDREDIKKELENHIHDKVDYYYNTRGIDAITAEELTLRDMGDPKEIGIALNKEHNFILGWIYKITNILVVIALIMTVFSLSITLQLSTIFSGNPKNDIQKESIVYNIKINEKVKLDDRVIKFKNVIYEKNGNMNIVYEHYDSMLFGMGWSFSNIGTVKDNLGNEYFSGSGFSSGGIITNGVKTISNFSNEADTLIIEYDRYNRYYKVEVPLKAGDSNE